MNNYDRNNSEMEDTAAFSFSKMATTWIVVDGTGEQRYAPENITCHYESDELVLPSDLDAARGQIKQKMQEDEGNGIRQFWNGPRYRLKRFLLSRSANNEVPQIDLWFGPSDYLTFLATNMRLNEHALRSKYIHTDWSQPVEYFSNAFAVYLAVETSDGYLITTRRSQNVMSRPGECNVSFSEGLSRDLDQINGVPDIYNCANRGAKEELGISLDRKSINLLSFGVDTQYSQWAFLGMTKIERTMEDIKKIRRMGVSDKWENATIEYVRFDPDSMIEYVFSSKPWAPGALVCIYNAMVYKFGTEVREKLLNL